MNNSNIDYFVNRQKELLKIEKEEESKRSTRKFVTVVTRELRSAVIGSFEVELRVLKCPNELKPQLRVGAPVLLFVKNTETIRGVVSKTLAGGSFDCVVKRIDHDILDAEKYFCSVSQDSITMKKYFETLEKIQRSHVTKFNCQEILNIAFDPNFQPSMNSGDFKVKKWWNENLNETQRNSVEFALFSDDVSLIIGPPGTGKTTTVVELIKQLVIHENLRVLCAAPSNVAIDNVMSGLLFSSTPEDIRRLKCCRLGHVARIKSGLMNHSLTYLVNKQMSQESVRMRREIEKGLKSISKTKRIGEKKRMKREIYQLRKELRKYERKTIQDVVSQCNCVLGTLTGCGNERLVKSGQFDVVIVDECAQSLEVATWMACLKTKKKIVLVGDFHQLGPTILTAQPKIEKELSVSLMERLFKMYGRKISRMLETQYRMNEDIMGFSSGKFYGGKLNCGPGVAERLLVDLDQVEDIEETSTPLFFIDTSDCGFHESSTSKTMSVVNSNTGNNKTSKKKNSKRSKKKNMKRREEEEEEDGKIKKKYKSGKDESKLNEKEITNCLIPHLERLLESGVKEETIGVITFYNGQVQCMKNLLSEKYPLLEISTVDGFQGREKEVILISFVRSNEEGEVGFLKNSRRINVAITRAKRHLCVIGDSVTLRKNPFLDDFIKYLNDNADVRNADDVYE